jgi:hypothetical protein
LTKQGIEPVIPPRSNRKTPLNYRSEAYKRGQKTVNTAKNCQHGLAIRAAKLPLTYGQGFFVARRLLYIVGQQLLRW